MILRLWVASWAFLSWMFPKFIAKKAENYFISPAKVARPKSELLAYESSEKIKFKNGIAGFRWGQSSDPLVVLLHGWNGRGTQMAPFKDLLLQHNFQVLALDGPAHGESEGTQTHVGQFSQFLIDVQKELNLPFKAIISHSFGTGCSVIANSWGLNVEKLVLIAGPAKYQIMIANYLKRIRLSPRSTEYFYANLAEKSGLNPKDINIGRIGSKLNTPTLIVHDFEDQVVRFQAALDIKEEWPSVEIYRTEGLGHRRILKDKAVIEKVVRFITGPS